MKKYGIISCVFYLVLMSYAVIKSEQEKKADLIIFSYKRPLQLYALLESVEKYVSGLHHITVLYRADNEDYEQSYCSIKSDFEDVDFIRQSTTHPQGDFKLLLFQILCTSNSDYIVFATDDDLIKDYVSIVNCIETLHEAHADGFHLRLGKNVTYCYTVNKNQQIPPLSNIKNDIYLWHFDPKTFETGYDWVYPNTVDMTLYSKQKIVQDLSRIDFNNPTSLEGMWFFIGLNGPPQVGLCFEQSKVVNIPHNKVQNVALINRSMEGNPDQLHELFKAGFKIDIKPFHLWCNKSAHSESEFNFVHR